MSSKLIRAALWSAALFAIGDASQAAESDPADAKAAVPRLDYRSPFAGYRGQRDIEPTPWRAANERVLQRGGWKAYAREAAGSNDAPATVAPAASTAGHRP